MNDHKTCFDPTITTPKKRPATALAPLLLALCLLLNSILPSCCSADTFTHKTTGETFNGYETRAHRAGNALIRCADGTSRHLDPSDYEVESNFLGRKNNVIVITIANSMMLECEAAAFEKAIAAAANAGPLFVLIEIDTPGGRLDILNRMYTAIGRTDYCLVVAFITGGEYGGAYSGGAFVALACEQLCMAPDAAIGAAAPIIMTRRGPLDLDRISKTFAAKMTSATKAQLAALAEQAGRPPLLAEAMVDKGLEVLEVTRAGRRLFVTADNKQPGDSVVRLWSRKGQLLSLTASESVQVGIANHSVKSRNDLLETLGAAKARVLRNTDMEKARKAFQAAEKRLEKTKNDLDLLARELITLDREVTTLDADYARQSQTLDNMIRARYHINAIDQQRNLLHRIALHRSRLLASATQATAGIVKAYDGAIALGKKNPDLQIDDEALKRAVNSAHVLIKRIQRIP